MLQTVFFNVLTDKKWKTWEELLGNAGVGKEMDSYGQLIAANDSIGAPNRFPVICKC